MTKVRGNTLVRLMNTLVKSSIQWRTRWLDLVSWPTVFTLGLRPYEINHSSMNTKAKKKKTTTSTYSPSRPNAFKPPQNPSTQRHEGSERIAKEHMCARYRLWPLGHQHLTCLFISSNISVVAISSNQSLRGNLHFTRLRVTSAFWSSIEDFSAYCPVLRGFIMLRPGHPLVFARMARWQSWSTTLYFTCFQFWEMSLIIPYFYLFKPLSSWKVFCLY